MLALRPFMFLRLSVDCCRSGLPVSILNRGLSGCVQLQKKDAVGIVRLNDPNSKVNCISKQFFLDFSETLKLVEADDSLNAVVIISGKPDCFIAGADIGMIAACKTQEEAQKLSSEAQSLMMKLETFRKPVVAAIMGSCLGGGLELALACHYRIAVDSKQTILGCPEVKLGLLPAAGGTQRLLSRCPRVDQALRLAMLGTTLTVPNAKRMGLVDQVVSSLGPGLAPPIDNTLSYLESVAISGAKQLSEGKLKPPTTRRSLIQRLQWKSLRSIGYARKMFFNYTRNQVFRRSHGLYPAPLKIIDIVENSIASGHSSGYAMETQAFGELAMTKESKALIGLFFSHGACKKSRLPAPKQGVSRLAVLGAGLMGSGIAEVSIRRGFPTVMKDVSSPSLARGEEYIQSSFGNLVKRKRMSKFESEKTFSLLESTVDFDPLKTVDMVIEAVFEDLSVKQRVVKEVEAVLPPHAIFASNTSAIPIHRIAEASKRPEKFIGMHYFSPVNKMELLEVIVMDKTSSDTVSSAINVGLRQGKVIIVVKDTPGFYTTRILGPVISEALLLMQEGVSPTEIDKATLEFGWPVGFATLVDEVGIDVVGHVTETLLASFPTRMKGGDCQLLKHMTSSGMLGRKSGKGLFVYSGKKSGNRLENSDATTVFENHRVAPKLENNRETIQFRLFSRFVNEAIHCLQDGTLINGPTEGDVGAVFGVGFPAHLGGPFRFVDLHGAANLVSRMEEFRKHYGEQFAPCQLLLDHTNDPQKRFHKQ